MIFFNFIYFNLGEGYFEVESEHVTCPSEDGEAVVVVVRKGGNAFPAVVTWSVDDGDAVFGKHYSLNEGKLAIVSDRKKT